MLEKEFRSKIVAALKPLRAFAVENDVHDGTPDVCCLAGWIELKVGTCPVRSTTRVDLGLRQAQAVWLRGWRRQGGRAWGMVLLNDEVVLLHDGLWAAENYDVVNSTDLVRNSLMTAVMPTSTFSRALMATLMKPLPAVSP
jgi:hypothetical protein